MRRSTLTTAALLMLGLLSPSIASHAQRPVTLGLGFGATMPLSDFGENLGPGWNALGTLAIALPVVPVGLRLDAAYNHFNVEKVFLGSVGQPESEHLTSFTVNPVIRLPAVSPLVTPYVIGGMGSYQMGCSGGEPCATTTKVGWNLGGGATFKVFGLTGFLEARYHHSTRGDVEIATLPLTFALTF
jgi:outer membrane protein with beta-barrel domain